MLLRCRGKQPLVEVCNQLPPVWSVQNITVVQGAEALRQSNLVLAPASLPRDNLNFCNLQRKLGKVHLLGRFEIWLVLGHARPHQMVATLPVLVRLVLTCFCLLEVFGNQCFLKFRPFGNLNNLAKPCCLAKCHPTASKPAIVDNTQ